MKSKVFIKVSICLLFSLSITSCYKETIIVPNPKKLALNFIMDSAQEMQIINARGQQFEVTDPLPVLKLTDDIIPVEKLEIRGDNTLRFRRKGYSVKLNSPLKYYFDNEPEEKKIKEFKLLALVYDYTYIEYFTATNIFKEAGLWPMYSYQTEVQINNHTQGVYLFIEDPVEYFIKKENAAVVIRRGYLHTQKSFKANASVSTNTADFLSSQFNKIYSDIAKYSGKQLYDTLSSYIDLENYFTKISIDMLLENGDYNDEIYFYALNHNGRYIFRVFPWDLDDLFITYPHEIGRAWAMSTIFGTRVYNSMDDIYNDVGHKLIFSIEDDLDYKIAKDDFMYSEYLKTLERVVSKYDAQTVDRIFNITEESLLPFYENDSIIAQSRYDVQQTNFQLFKTNITEKRTRFKNRVKWVSEELTKLN